MLLCCQDPGQTVAKNFCAPERGQEQEERSKLHSQLRVHEPGLKPGGQGALSVGSVGRAAIPG